MRAGRDRGGKKQEKKENKDMFSGHLCRCLPTARTPTDWNAGTRVDPSHLHEACQVHFLSHMQYFSGHSLFPDPITDKS